MEEDDGKDTAHESEPKGSGLMTTVVLDSGTPGRRPAEHLDLLSIVAPKQSFKEWLADFEVKDEGVQRVFQWLQEDNLEKLEDLLTAMMEQVLRTEQFTDRYHLMSTFLAEVSVAKARFQEELPNIADILLLLPKACFRLDNEVGLERGLTQDLSSEDQAAMIRALDLDEKNFEKILREEYFKLPSQTAQLLFLEFGRCIHAFNGYQPPPREEHEAYKLRTDGLDPLCHYDDVLERFEQWIISEIGTDDLANEEDAAIEVIDNDDDNNNNHDADDGEAIKQEGEEKVDAPGVIIPEKMKGEEES